jgi:PST family polysaccharide transporter
MRQVLKPALLRNIFSLYLLQGVNYLLPLIVTPYLIRVLGGESYGSLALVMAINQYLMVITNYGFNNTATRQIALSANDPNAVSRIYSRVMVTKLFLTTITLTLMVILTMIIPTFHEGVSLYMAGFLAVIGNFLFPLWLFQGLQKMGLITILNVIAKFSTTLCIFLFVKKPSDCLLAVLFQSLNFLLPGLLSLWCVPKLIPIKFGDDLRWQVIINELKMGKEVFFSGLLGNVYGQGGIIITGVIAGHTEAGYYSIAQKISAALVGLMQPVVQGIYPYICNLYEQSAARFNYFKRRIVLGAFIIGVGVAGAGFLFSAEIVKLIVGIPSARMVGLVDITSIVTLFTIMNVLLNGFILAMNRYKPMQIMYLLVSISFLIISIPLTEWLASYGMAYSILFVELFIFIISLSITKESREKSYPVKA